MIGRLLEPELTELIHRREFNPLREILSRFPLEDIAEILTDQWPAPPEGTPSTRFKPIAPARVRDGPP